MDEAELHVARVSVVSEPVVGRGDGVNTRVCERLLEHIDELELGSNCAFSVSVK